MVKGVNKSIIEISQTGSKYFSKIILYVSPLYADTSSYKLAGEAEKLVRELSGINYQPLRTRVRKTKMKKLIICLSGAAVFIASAILYFFVL